MGQICWKAKIVRLTASKVCSKCILTLCFASHFSRSPLRFADVFTTPEDEHEENDRRPVFDDAQTQSAVIV